MTGELDPVVPRSDCELVASRVLDARPESVFDAFRSAEKLARWWGPHGFSNTFHEFDFRAGGWWKFTMHGPDGKDYANESRFLEIDAPSRIVIEHLSNPHFVAEILITPQSTNSARSAARIAYTQTFDSAEVCRRIAEYAGSGNEENLDRLEALLRTENR